MRKLALNDPRLEGFLEAEARALPSLPEAEGRCMFGVAHRWVRQRAGHHAADRYVEALEALFHARRAGGYSQHAVTTLWAGDRGTLRAAEAPFVGWGGVGVGLAEFYPGHVLRALSSFAEARGRRPLSLEGRPPARICYLLEGPTALVAFTDAAIYAAGAGESWRFSLSPRTTWYAYPKQDASPREWLHALTRLVAKLEGLEGLEGKLVDAIQAFLERGETLRPLLGLGKLRQL